MTNQEKKAYLKRYRLANAEINDLIQRRDEIMSLVCRVTPTYSGMPGGGGDSDKMTNGVAKLIEVEREIDQRVDCLVDFRREIERKIAEIGDPMLERVLLLRYIDGFNWKRIHVEMAAESESYGASERWIYQLHGRALLRLDVCSKVK